MNIFLISYNIFFIDMTKPVGYNQGGREAIHMKNKRNKKASPKAGNYQGREGLKHRLTKNSVSIRDNDAAAGIGFSDFNCLSF